MSDGVNLYFIEGMPYTTGSRLMQVSAAGGETSPVPTTIQNAWAVAAVSPDRSELMVGSGVVHNGEFTVELWVQPLPAGSAHRLGDIDALLGNWTPDGSHIVYADFNAIHIANKDGSNPRKLAEVHGAVFSIRYSPDGRRIRFDLTDPATESNSIWEMDSDGTNIHPLFPDWKNTVQGGGRWSPDGKYYYFQTGSGSDQAIWVLPEDRSFFRRKAIEPTRLVAGPLRFGSPLPSSDGKRLFVFGEDPRVELVRYDQRARRFDPYLSGQSVGPIDFSRDGKWMAYISYPDMTLWRSHVDGSEKMQLTFPPARAYEPRWSPDGSQIVFMDVRYDAPWQIHLISASGGTARVLLGPDTSYADATWMPDGKSIIFGKHAEDEGNAVYRLELGTKNVSQIPDSIGFSSPRVSPDGRYIAAVGHNSLSLMLFDTRTGQWSLLAEGEKVGYNEWSHDGQYIYFRRQQGEAAELARVRMKDRIVQSVLSLRDVPLLSDYLANWVGLTPDDAPLVMRNRSIQEFYALDLQFR